MNHQSAAAGPQRLWLLAAAAFALLVAAMATSWWLLGRQRIEEQWVRHTDAVLRYLDALLADMVDSETAERGFVISGQPSFLQPYESARKRFADDLTQLKLLTRDNLAQQRRIAAAERVARAEFAAFARVIALRQVDVPAAMAAVAGGGDKLFTDEVRRRLGEMKREELGLLMRRQTAAAATGRRTVLIVFAVHGAALLGLVSAAWAVQRSRERRRSAERESARLEAVAKLALERRERDDFREQFLGVVGHDLRTPLGAIAIEAQLLGELHDSQERREAGVRILQSTRRMTRMVDQLLDVTRSRLGGGLPIQRRACDLRAVMEGATRELANLHPDRMAIDAASPIQGMFDPDRVAQVVSNLVGNALAHGEGRVKVKLDARGAEAQLSVHNRGKPIAPEQLAHVFEAFRPGGGERSGLGLGLFITDQIVRGHGGRVEVHSNHDDGTTFTVFLPLASGT